MTWTLKPKVTRFEQAAQMLALKADRLETFLVVNADRRDVGKHGAAVERIVVGGTNVEFARALVNDPSLILADEPTGNLDTSSGAAIMQVLSDLHTSGRTVLVVSHDPRMIRFATHKIFLLDGRIVSEDQYQSAALESLQPS